MRGRGGQRGDATPGIYRYISEADEARVEKRFGDLHQPRQEHGNVGVMSADDRVALLKTHCAAAAERQQQADLRARRSPASRIVTTSQTCGEVMERRPRVRHSLDTLRRQPQTPAAIGRQSETPATAKTRRDQPAAAFARFGSRQFGRGKWQV